MWFDYRWALVWNTLTVKNSVAIHPKPSSANIQSNFVYLFCCSPRSFILSNLFSEEMVLLSHLPTSEKSMAVISPISFYLKDKKPLLHGIALYILNFLSRVYFTGRPGLGHHTLILYWPRIAACLRCNCIIAYYFIYHIPC